MLQYSGLPAFHQTKYSQRELLQPHRNCDQLGRLEKVGPDALGAVAGELNIHLGRGARMHAYHLADSVPGVADRLPHLKHLCGRLIEAGVDPDV